MSILEFITSYNNIPLNTFSYYKFDNNEDLVKYENNYSCNSIPNVKCELHNISFWIGSIFYSGDLNIFMNIEEYNFQINHICDSCTVKIDELYEKNKNSYYLLSYNCQYKNQYLINYNNKENINSKENSNSKENNNSNEYGECNCEFKIFNEDMIHLLPCISDCVSNITHYQITNKKIQIPTKDDIKKYNNFIEDTEIKFNTNICLIEKHLDNYNLSIDNYKKILDREIKYYTKRTLNSFQSYGFNTELEYNIFIN